MSASQAATRSLTALVESASTARVLNLAKRTDAQRRATPPDRLLFRTPALDRAVIVKHHMRPQERDRFVAANNVATKIMIPIDPAHLNFGAHVIMVGQKGYDEMLVQALAIDKDREAGEHDRAVLSALDDLPSLDPFLTREHLKRRGFHVSEDYFDITPADVLRMSTFVKQDILPLISLCFGEAASQAQIDIFSQKLLGAELDASMDPLRSTLKMDANEFAEGVFCWKGFLYYKWVFAEINQRIGSVSRAIGEVRATDDSRTGEDTYIEDARVRVKAAVKTACSEVRQTLLAYDRAFEGLTRRGDAGAFRDFLFASPKMFFDVGEKLGAVQHITGFWAFRFGIDVEKPTMPAHELFDVFSDFEASLGLEGRASQARAA